MKIKIKHLEYHMTQEDKFLLLQDLCARLPFHPKCEMIDELRVVNNEKDSLYISTLFPKHIELFSYHNNFTIRPYLRPLSSMTEEEFGELEKYSELIHDQLNLASFQDGAYKCLDFYLTEVPSDVVIRVFDWLNKNHFDYRGLIEKGLALEAPEGMYN